MDDSGIFFTIFAIIFLGYEFLMGIEDDVVYPATYERAVERCEVNQGLKHLEQVGGLLGMHHTVICNDGAKFKIERRYNEGLQTDDERPE